MHLDHYWRLVSDRRTSRCSAFKFKALVVDFKEENLRRTCGEILELNCDLSIGC